MNSFSETLTLLSAMITPVVLIMASSSLILSTSQRLSRSIERTRKITEAMKNIINKEDMQSPSRELLNFFEQLNLSARRARLLQQAMSCLYLTLLIFVASCISIALVYLFFKEYSWVPVSLDILGVGVLFFASYLLIRESTLAYRSVNKEMAYTLQLFRDSFPIQANQVDSPWWKRIQALKKHLDLF